MSTSTTYPTFEALKAATDDFVGSGWRCIPYDDPKRGVVGNRLVRYTCKGQPVEPGTHDPQCGELDEELFTLTWKPFGDVTVAERVIYRDDSVDIAECLNELSGKRLFRCDDPKRLLLGFVYYESGLAHVTYVAMTRIKGESGLQIAGRSFLEWRDSLPTLRDVALTT